MDKQSLEKRIGFTLSEESFAEIPFEAGFTSNQKELFEKNNFYVDWGRAIICAVYAFNLYSTNNDSSIDELNTKVKSSYQPIETEIYKLYNLKEFVAKGNYSAAKSYPEITSKLIVLIYMQYGFIAVDTFLKSTIQKLQSTKTLDCAEIIEMYAHYKNQKLSYQTSYVSGRHDEKIYRCKITIGSQYAEGREIGINNAQTKAEINFCQKYENSIEKFLSGQKSNKKDRTMTDERKKQLIDAIKLLGLNGRYLTFEQMDEILTHPSCRNKMSDQPSVNNTVLAYLGRLLLDMLSYEYCFLRSSKVFDRQQEILSHNGLSDCLSEQYLLYLLRNPNIGSNDTNEKMKSDVFQGILASYWINFLVSKDNSISDLAKTFVFEKIELSELIINADYLDFVEKIANLSGWDVVKSSKFIGQDENNKELFDATITVSGIYWEQSGTGTDHRESSAINLAAKNVLEKLPRYCDNSEIAASIQNKLSAIPRTVTSDKGTAAISESQPTKNTNPTPVLISEPPEEVSFDRSENTLYICKGTISCERKHHKIISATGILLSLDQEPVKIDVQYCTSCRMYFINQDTYMDYLEEFGNLIGNFDFTNYISAKGNGSSDWADKSILKLCGYNVDKQNNLSEEKRRFILKNIMIRNILPKYRIEEYLVFFIRMNENDRDKIMAVRKWKADLIWVRNFNIDQQRQFWINEIKKTQKS